MCGYKIYWLKKWDGYGNLLNSENRLGGGDGKKIYLVEQEAEQKIIGFTRVGMHHVVQDKNVYTSENESALCLKSFQQLF